MRYVNGFLSGVAAVTVGLLGLIWWAARNDPPDDPADSPI